MIGSGNAIYVKQLLAINKGDCMKKLLAFAVFISTILTFSPSNVNAANTNGCSVASESLSSNSVFQNTNFTWVIQANCYRHPYIMNYEQGIGYLCSNGVCLNVTGKSARSSYTYSFTFLVPLNFPIGSATLKMTARGSDYTTIQEINSNFILDVVPLPTTTTTAPTTTTTVATTNQTLTLDSDSLSKTSMVLQSNISSNSVYWTVRVRDPFGGRLTSSTVGARLCPTTSSWPDGAGCTGATSIGQGNNVDRTYTFLFLISPDAPTGQWLGRIFGPVSGQLDIIGLSRITVTAQNTTTTTTTAPITTIPLTTTTTTTNTVAPTTTTTIYNPRITYCQATMTHYVNSVPQWNYANWQQSNEPLSTYTSSALVYPNSYRYPVPVAGCSSLNTTPTTTTTSVPVVQQQAPAAPAQPSKPQTPAAPVLPAKPVAPATPVQPPAVQTPTATLPKAQPPVVQAPAIPLKPKWKYVYKKVLQTVYSNVRTGAICRDGSSSTATRNGACSGHGGVKKFIHLPPKKVYVNKKHKCYFNTKTNQYTSNCVVV
jgi:hypothetical protein